MEFQQQTNEISVAAFQQSFFAEEISRNTNVENTHLITTDTVESPSKMYESLDGLLTNLDALTSVMKI